MKCDKCEKEAVRTSITSHLCEDHLFSQPLAQPLDDKGLPNCDKYRYINLGKRGEIWLYDKKLMAKTCPMVALLQPKIDHLIDQLKLADKNYLELKNAFDERIEEARRQEIAEVVGLLLERKRLCSGNVSKFITTFVQELKALKGGE